MKFNKYIKLLRLQGRGEFHPPFKGGAEERGGGF